MGLTYKKLQNLSEAKTALEGAAGLQPKINNALPELIDVLYQLNDLENAKKWIETAEKEMPSSAQIAFLKGLVLLKEKKEPEKAIEAFDSAKKLDESLAESVEYYKGFAYLQMEKTKKAKEVFNQIVVRDPSTSLAAYANEYVDAITRKEKAEQPLRANIAFAMQYDDNVILKPQDDQLSIGIPDKGDWRQTYTGQAEYNYKPVD